MNGRFIVALLALMPAVVIAQPVPTPLPVRAELEARALVVTWQPPPGQAVACVERADGLLLTCVVGGARRLQLGPGSLVEGQRLTAGDGVRVRAWSVAGAEVGRGEARVFGPVRWLPSVER
jgi:hypothetical protein